MSKLPQEIIARVRDGDTLAEDEIADFVSGLTSNAWSEGQVAALAMAVYLNGLGADETAALTRAMTESGQILDWTGFKLNGPVVDKHSSGGVGDKVSLILAPWCASLGLHVPMISGRGLGHTGGTLDKLESIPGFETKPDLKIFQKIVAETGCAIIGQTDTLAPADRRFYAVRDITATVESLPLITASILSKKLAAGIGALVMDIKCGSGAFMRTQEEARALAASIQATGKKAGLKVGALVSDMNSVLGHSAGNAVEVREVIDFLTGSRRDTRLLECSRALVLALARLGGLSPDGLEEKADRLLADGTVAERLQAMVAAQGGPVDVLEKPESHLPEAGFVTDVKAPAGGTIAAMDVRSIGLTVIRLGGGRRQADDSIDHAVGITDMLAVGDQVAKGQALARVHARSEEAGKAAAAEILKAVRLGEGPDPSPPVILENLSQT